MNHSTHCSFNYTTTFLVIINNALTLHAYDNPSPNINVMECLLRHGIDVNHIGIDMVSQCW